MVFDVRTAALDEDVERRVRLAVSLLGAKRVHATVSAWSGARCHLLVASMDDAYGRRTLSLAMRRGTPVLALGLPFSGMGLEPLTAQATAVQLAEGIQHRLTSTVELPASAISESAGPGSTESHVPMLCQLAQAPLRGRVVALSSRGRGVLIHSAAGRVYAPGSSDLLMAAETLATSGWVARIAKDTVELAGLASISLEAFFLRSAWHSDGGLPAFPKGFFQLSAWPDLGTVPQMVGALEVARGLLGKARSVAQLQEDLKHISRAQINACLWAFAGADLLRECGDSAPVPSASAGLAPAHALPWWAALARRFGLHR